MSRIPVLDGLRGLAIALVLIFHFIGDNPNTGHPLADSVLFMARGCWVGVDAFFVLSGFLITGILLKSKGEQGWLKNFYARRSLRIFPLYYLWVALYLVVAPKVAPEIYDGITGHSALLLCYLTNFVAHSPGANHTWSLAVEEQYYLVWPLLISLLQRTNLLKLIMGGLVASMLFRVAISLQWTPLHPIKIYTLPFTHFDGLLIGSTVALLRFRGGLRWNSTRTLIASLGAGMVLISCFLVGGGPSFWSNQTIAIIGYPLAAVAFALLLIALLNDPRPRLAAIFSSIPLVILGKYSYFIYLFHVPAFVYARSILRSDEFFAAHLDIGPIAWIAEATAVSLPVVLLAAISWRFFEEPILRLKKRFA